MKDVLIIGYLWPHCRYQGGSPRTLGLARYMMDFGWRPIIITAALSNKPDLPSEVRLLETPNRDFFYFWKRLFGLFGFRPNESVSGQLKEKIGVTSKKSIVDYALNTYMAIFAFPDTEKHWRSFALRSAGEELKKRKARAAISVWPVTAHVIANELKKKYGIPWVADFSHLWSQGYYYQYGPIRKTLDERMEKKTLRGADAITTISPFFAERLRELHKRQPVYSVIHGFDPNTLNVQPERLTSKFSITYTGSVQPGKQNPSKLFQVLKEMIDSKFMDRNDLEVSFYGAKHGWLAEEIEHYGLSDVIQQHGAVPQTVAIQKQRESQVLLHLGWDDKEIQGFYTSKIFEYLAAQRPILGVGGASDQVVKDLLSDTKAGVYSTCVRDIREFLKEFYSEYKREGQVTYKGDMDKINGYSHREMAKNFADILNQIVKGTSPTN